MNNYRQNVNNLEKIGITEGLLTSICKKEKKNCSLLSMKEIEGLIRKGDLQTCASNLVELLEKRMGDPESKFHKPDDFSFLLFSP